MTDFVRLGDIASSSYGLTASASDDPTGHRFLRITDIVNGIPGSYESVPFVDVDESSATKYRLNRGDIVVARTGATVGATHWFRGWYEPVLYASYLVRFIPNPSIADSRFVGYALQSPAWDDYVYANAFAKSAQPNMSAGVMADHTFRLPPLHEQKRIGQLLGTLDDKIVANHATASLSKILIRSTAEGLGNQTPLAELAVRNKRSLNPSKMPDELVVHYSIPRFDVGSPIIEPAHAIKSSKIVVKQPNVLVSKLNPETPRVWSVPRPSDDFVSLASTEFISLEPDQITQSQLYAATLHPAFHNQLASLVGGTSKSHQRVKPDEMLQCLVPDIRELSANQIRLLETLSQLEAQAVQENLTLTKTRDELLPLLMSGKITVREAEQEATAAGADSASEESEA